MQMRWGVRCGKSKTMSRTTSSTRCIQLSREQLKRVLDRLAGTPKSPDKDFSFRTHSCVIRLGIASEDDTLSLEVPTRRLGRESLTFLLDREVGVGSPCEVELVDSDNQAAHIPGTISDCNVVESDLYDVRVTFSLAIETSRFFGDTSRLNVLLVEDNKLFIALATTMLSDMDVDVTVASNGYEAIEKAGEQASDLILSDIEMPEMDGLEAVRRLRESGYAGRITAVSGRNGTDVKLECAKAGFDSYLSKPIQVSALQQQIACLREEPLYSSLAGDAGLSSILREFLMTIPERMRACENAMQERESDRLIDLCQELYCEAGSIGFEPIAQAANKMVAQVTAGTDCKSMGGVLTELMAWCRRARAHANGHA